MEKNYHPLHVLIGVLMFGGILFFGLNAPEPSEQIAQAQSAEASLTGWAWSDTTGWISMNCTNPEDGVSCGTSDYGVLIDPDTGELSGNAWSQHVGWISFDRAQTGNPPLVANAPGTTDPGNGSGAIAQFNQDGELLGWARALSGCESIPCSEYGGGETDTIAYVRSGGVTGGTSFSMDIGEDDTNRLVAIFASHEDDNDDSLTSVKVDGKNCTYVVDENQTESVGLHTELWYCDEDNLSNSVGSVTISTTGGSNEWVLSANLYTGVSQDGPASTKTKTTSSNTSRITVTSVNVPTNGLVILGATSNKDSETWDTYTSPLTERADIGDSNTDVRLGVASAVETTAKTGQSYYAEMSADYSRAVAIAASWEPYTEPGNTSDGPGSNTGNWDGWISFSDTTRTDGIAINGSNLEGFAWGSEVVGWIQFDDSYIGGGFDGGVTLTGDLTGLGFEGADPESDPDGDDDNDGIPNNLEGVCTFSPAVGTPLTEVTWQVNEDLITGGNGTYSYEWNFAIEPTPTPTNSPIYRGYFPEGYWSGTVTISSGPLSETVTCEGEGGGTVLTIVAANPGFDVIIAPQNRSLLINTVPKTATYTASVFDVQDLDGGSITITPVLPAALQDHAEITPSSATISSPYTGTPTFTVTITGNDDSLRGTHTITFNGSAAGYSTSATANLSLTKSSFNEF